MVDISFLQKFTKGNTKKMQRYIKLYFEEAEKSFQQMRKNVKQQDWQALRVNAHSLKPQAELLGIASLKEALMDIEDAVEAEEWHDLPVRFDTALQLHQAALPILKGLG